MAACKVTCISRKTPSSQEKKGKPQKEKATGQELVASDSRLLISFAAEHCASFYFHFLEADRSTMTNERFLSKMKSYWQFWKRHCQLAGLPLYVAKLRHRYAARYHEI